jgi:formyltetrahydrofolate-dependent phosphoribosylglycinamide formyltransferase
VRVGVLISGRGSNMAALVRAAQAPDYPAEIALVLSDKADAPGLEVAHAMGVQAQAVASGPFGKDRAAHEQALDAALRAAGVEIVALAGYMRLLTPGFVEAWRGRMLNIHPSLLPAFRGLDTHARALAAGASEAGCTVHLVTEALDEGPILGQARVPILPGDDAASLAERVLEAEHRLYPERLAMVCRDILRGDGA